MFNNHDDLIIKLFFTRKNGTQINGNITTKVKKKYPNNFIEIQGYYTHGKEPYNPNSIKHQVLIQRYKERYGPNCQAITIWTIKDVEKRECAKKNNLNFKEIWTLEEGKKFIDFLYEMYK